MGKNQQEQLTTLRNENGILLERKDVLDGFVGRFRRTFQISEDDNQNFDEENEEMVDTFIRNNRNRITIDRRTDTTCNYNRGADARIHTYEIL